MSKPVLAISIHMGMAYTVVAYVKVGQNQPVRFINSWPAHTNSNMSTRVPTSVCYLPLGGGDKRVWAPHSFGFAAVDAGSGEKTVCQKFKWYLGAPEEVPYATDSPLERRWEKINKEPADVAHAYLELLYSHILRILKTLKQGPDIFEYKIVFTGSGSLGRRGREKFKEVLRRSSFSNHDISTSMSETIAATIFILARAIRVFQPLKPKKQCVIICQASGHLRDIISYTVSEVRPEISLDSFDVISGCFAGDEGVDTRFLQWFLDNALDHNSRHAIKHTQDGDDAMRVIAYRFIEECRRFDDSGSSFLSLGNAAINANLTGPRLKRDKTQIKMIIPGDMMRAFLEVPLKKTCEGLKQQVKKCEEMGLTVSSICLVGEFGGFRYISSAAISEMEKSRRDIPVTCPQSSEFAVVLGALQSLEERYALAKGSAAESGKRVENKPRSKSEAENLSSDTQKAQGDPAPDLQELTISEQIAILLNKSLRG